MGYISDFFMEEEWSLVVVKLVILRETKRGRPNKTFFQANFSGTYKYPVQLSYTSPWNLKTCSNVFVDVISRITSRIN